MQYIWSIKAYRKIIQRWISEQPKEGYGQASRIASYLKTSRTIVSQILKGERDLTIEQGYEITKFLDMNESQTEYFLALLNSARAGSQSLKNFYNKQAERIKTKSQSISGRTDGRKIDKKAQERFYSDYAYSAVRLSTELSDIRTANDISHKLGVDVQHAQNIIEFLLRYKLVIFENGSLELGPASTHVGKDEPAVINHHRNWRIEAMKRMGKSSEDNLFYTAPTAITLEVSEWLTQSLLSLIEDLSKKAQHINGTELRCFNFDLFTFSS